jgi:3-oxoacyl-[acyl-carrier-protein] synthase II
MSAVITGTGLAVAGAGDGRALLHPAPDQAAPVDTAARIGGRGLRYKDRASQLAMCAAGDALRASGLTAASGELRVPAASVGVVASSNTGNLDTVCLAADLLNAESTDSLSPMALPNASSNVVASSVALRFGLRGPNLMLCNGSCSGLDAIYWGIRLLATGRCGSVVVVGVEPRNAVVAKLTGLAESELFDGAAAVVMTTMAGEGAADAHGATPAARPGRFARVRGLAACVAEQSAGADVRAWFTPQTYDAGLMGPDVARYDLTAAFGWSSGALGVLQCVAAAGWFAAGNAGVALLTNGGGADAAACGMLLHPPETTARDRQGA